MALFMRNPPIRVFSSFKKDHILDLGPEVEEMMRVWVYHMKYPPLFYTLRSEESAGRHPSATVCLLQDEIGNVSRGIALYKPEPKWPYSKRYGRYRSFFRSLWALVHKKDGRYMKTHELVKNPALSLTLHGVDKKTVPVLKKSVALLVCEDMIPTEDGSMVVEKIPKCFFNPSLTDREKELIEKVWNRPKKEKTFLGRPPMPPNPNVN